MNQVLAARPAFDSVVWMDHRSQSGKVPVTARQSGPGSPEDRSLSSLTHRHLSSNHLYFYFAVPIGSIHKRTRHPSSSTETPCSQQCLEVNV